MKKQNSRRNFKKRKLKVTVLVLGRMFDAEADPLFPNSWFLKEAVHWLIQRNPAIEIPVLDHIINRTIQNELSPADEIGECMSEGHIIELSTISSDMEICTSDVWVGDVKHNENNEAEIDVLFCGNILGVKIVNDSKNKNAVVQDKYYFNQTPEFDHVVAGSIISKIEGKDVKGQGFTKVMKLILRRPVRITFQTPTDIKECSSLKNITNWDNNSPKSQQRSGANSECSVMKELDLVNQNAENSVVNNMQPDASSSFGSTKSSIVRARRAERLKAPNGHNKENDNSAERENESSSLSPLVLRGIRENKLANGQYLSEHDNSIKPTITSDKSVPPGLGKTSNICESVVPKENCLDGLRKVPRKAHVMGVGSSANFVAKTLNLKRPDLSKEDPEKRIIATLDQLYYELTENEKKRQELVHRIELFQKRLHGINPERARTYLENTRNRREDFLVESLQRAGFVVPSVPYYPPTPSDCSSRKSVRTDIYRVSKRHNAMRSDASISSVSSVDRRGFKENTRDSWINMSKDAPGVGSYNVGCDSTLDRRGGVIPLQPTPRDTWISRSCAPGVGTYTIESKLKIKGGDIGDTPRCLLDAL